LSSRPGWSHLFIDTNPVRNLPHLEGLKNFFAPPLGGEKSPRLRNPRVPAPPFPPPFRHYLIPPLQSRLHFFLICRKQDVTSLALPDSPHHSHVCTPSEVPQCHPQKQLFLTSSPLSLHFKLLVLDPSLSPTFHPARWDAATTGHFPSGIPIGHRVVNFSQVGGGATDHPKGRRPGCWIPWIFAYLPLSGVSLRTF